MVLVKLNETRQREGLENGGEKGFQRFEERSDR